MSAIVREKPKGSGTWYVFVNDNGHRRAAKMPNRRTAEVIAKEINAEMIAGKFNLGTKEAGTVREYAERWMEHSTVKPATRSNYQSILTTHIYPKFADKPVDQIKRGDVKDFLKKKIKDGLSLSTAKNIKAALYNIFETALDDEAIPSNPASRVGELVARNQKAHTTGKAGFFTPEELTKLLNAFLKYRPQHYLLALLLARTGMRVGEAVALQWRDCNFDTKQISVRRAKSRTVIDTTKSGKDRLIDMSDQLASELRKKRTEAVSDSLRTGRRSDYIFVGRTSATLDPTAWRKRNFDPMCEKAGLGKRLVKDLRHTYASLLLYHGKSLKYVQQQLGHHSIKITADTYSHLIKNPDHGTVNVLDDVVSGE